MPTNLYNLWEVKEIDGLNTRYCIEKLKPFLISQNWKIRTSSNHIKAYQRGVHVNFRTELDVYFRDYGDGVIIEIHHYARLKVPSMIVCGVLTAGLTTIFGAGALSIHIQEGKKFIDRIWREIDIILKCQQASIIGRRGNSKRKLKNKPKNNPLHQNEKEVKEEVIIEEIRTTEPAVHMGIHNQNIVTQSIPLQTYDYYF